MNTNLFYTVPAALPQIPLPVPVTVSPPLKLPVQQAQSSNAPTGQSDRGVKRPHDSTTQNPSPTQSWMSFWYFSSKKDETAKPVSVQDKKPLLPGADMPGGFSQPQLGDLTMFSETGKLSKIDASKVISSGKNDPGGKSYGIYQLSSNKGTLNKFLQSSGYDKVITAEIGTSQFDQKWSELAVSDPSFVKAQHAFIVQTHFEPVAKHFDQFGFRRSKTIDEALFSMGVQHGRACMIVSDACKSLGKSPDETVIIQALYNARKSYVNGLSSLDQNMKNSLCKRYDRELAALLNPVQPTSLRPM